MALRPVTPTTEAGRPIASGISGAAILIVLSLAAPDRSSAAPPAAGNIVGTVTDTAAHKPVPGAEVRAVQNGRVVSVTSTDEFGRYTIHNLPVGTYDVGVLFIGFRPESRSISVPDGATVTADFALTAAPVELTTIETRASVTPLGVDTRSGDQTFKQDDYHGAPTATTSQILQQAIAGAARAPTGEVHIRGQHAEYTYYVDGVPVPSGISGSLNELFDPAVVNRIDFQTGGWDAEYGGKVAAVVNVMTRIPTGGFHYGLSGYGGSFSSNGQSAALSTNAGKWGFYLSGTRQATDMRLDPVVANPISFEPINYHNDGTDLYGFGKVQFVPGPHDVLNLDVSRSRTRFAVPFDSTNGVIDDHQQDINGFINLGWRHSFGGDTSSAVGTPAELFVGPFFRDGSLKYTPGKNDQPSFIFFPDTLTPYNLSEDRGFQTFGIKLDYTLRPRHGLEFKVGTLASLTRGNEDFVTTDSAGNRGPSSNSSLRGSDVGVYAQTALGLSEKWELRTGIRFDNHDAPFAGNQHQWSPRVRLSFFPDPSNTFWAYYGRLFIPTNVEDLRAITSVAQAGVAAEPTLPERDHFFELGYVHRFPFGVVMKLSGYHKASSPGIDDNTVPGSAIVTSVNIATVYINGIETVLEIRPRGPVSGFLNAALSHAYGHGPVTGGFFPEEAPTGFFDLDHDQRLSVTGGLTYSSRSFYVSATGIFGTGLTNGANPDSTYGTGLFDFNKSIKVSPSFILNASTGYDLVAGRTTIRPELFVDNLLNHHYLLKGTFFSGPSVGRPRSVQLRLSIGG
ncbi:MAG TPA: TonB-dependent receptor [Gemmatimonadales bacterium]|nr:TonB-dependent receptor [Gemmatimonadales bacterium]